jgi:hypothetical protein
MVCQHGGTAMLQRIFDGLDNRGMIVAQIVNTVAGKKVEDSTAIFGEELGSFAARIARVHPQNFQQPHPLGIDAFLVQRVFDQSAAGS